MYVCICMHACLRSHGQLFATIDYIPSGSSVRRILQAKILEWVAIPSPRDLPRYPELQGDSLLSEPPEKPVYMCMYVYMCVCVYINTHHIFFIHSSVEGLLGCLHVLTIVNSAAVNIEVHVSFLVKSFVPIHACPEVELLDHVTTLFLVF